MVISSRNSTWHFSKYFVIFNSPPKILCVIYFCSQVSTHSFMHWTNICSESLLSDRPYAKVAILGRLSVLSLYNYEASLTYSWQTFWILISRMCCLVAHSESWLPFFCHTYSRVLQKCFESDLSQMSAMPPGPVFQSLPLCSSPSCVRYSSDILWTKLKAVDCLRGFLCCFQTMHMWLFWTYLTFQWLNYFRNEISLGTGACLLPECVRVPLLSEKGLHLPWLIMGR